LSDTLWEAVMGDRTFLTSLVAVTLVRETIRLASEHDRLAVAGAAHRSAQAREHHEGALRRIAHERKDDGLVNAGVRGVAAAEFVARTFDSHDAMPDTEEAACLGEPERADNLIALAVQAAYEEMDGQLRLRFKQALRLCGSCAAPPLDVEVLNFLALCDSQDAWELELMLDQEG
jgi:hypothetical protein